MIPQCSWVLGGGEDRHLGLGNFKKKKLKLRKYRNTLNVNNRHYKKVKKKKMYFEFCKMFSEHSLIWLYVSVSVCFLDAPPPLNILVVLMEV
jgi:hypothetical protein